LSRTSQVDPQKRKEKVQMKEENLRTRKEKFHMKDKLEVIVQKKKILKPILKMPKKKTKE